MMAVCAHSPEKEKQAEGVVVRSKKKKGSRKELRSHGGLSGQRPCRARAAPEEGKGKAHHEGEGLSGEVPGKRGNADGREGEELSGQRPCRTAPGKRGKADGRKGEELSGQRPCRTAPGKKQKGLSSEVSGKRGNADNWKGEEQGGWDRPQDLSDPFLALWLIPLGLSASS